MYTILYFDPSQDDQRMKNAINSMNRVDGLVTAEIAPGINLGRKRDGYICTFDEYLYEIPESLAGLVVTKVTIEATFAGSVTPGIYRRRRAHAQADSYLSNSSFASFVKVEGQTLIAVNRLYSDIRGGKARPKIRWSTPEDETGVADC